MSQSAAAGDKLFYLTKHEPSDNPVLLYRLSPGSDLHSENDECVGSCYRQIDGTWKVRLPNIPIELAMVAQCRLESRDEAIDSLWVRRQEPRPYRLGEAAERNR